MTSELHSRPTRGRNKIKKIIIKDQTSTSPPYLIQFSVSDGRKGGGRDGGKTKGSIERLWAIRSLDGGM